jgi:hypothetical protein
LTDGSFSKLQSNQQDYNLSLPVPERFSCWNWRELGAPFGNQFSQGGNSSGQNTNRVLHSTAGEGLLT